MRNGTEPPGTAGTAIQGAQLSIGNLLFFSLSTAALWNARRRSAGTSLPAPVPAPGAAADTPAGTP
ncbi:hypothetical protein ACIGJO_29440 [Streptomyces sp. NPDC079020]|uniref:hypothetical protein n=1 Tax=Streptomyces sp. NPDC079020 TaxID=3365722 RepID=UPI0037CF4714